MCPAEPHFLPKNCLFFSPKWPLSQKSPVNRDIYVCFSYTASLSDSSEAMISWQRKCLDRKWFCRALTIQKNVHEQSFFLFFFQLSRLCSFCFHAETSQFVSSSLRRPHHDEMYAKFNQREKGKKQQNNN